MPPQDQAEKLTKSRIAFTLELMLLVLFDIDGTLVDARGAGRRAAAMAFEKVLGLPCPELTVDDVAGALDSNIFALLMERGGVMRDGLLPQLLAAYADAVREILSTVPSVPLPGALEAVRAVKQLPSTELGLITGCARAVADIKLERAGFALEDFVCGGYGDESRRREELVKIALSRFEQRRGALPNKTVLIGDTPRDVLAARESGSEIIAVTSGPYSTEQLREAGARCVLPDLRDTGQLMAALERIKRDD